MKVKYIKETTPLSKTIAQLTHGKIYEVDQTHWNGLHFTLTDDDGDHVIVETCRFAPVIEGVHYLGYPAGNFELLEGGGEAPVEIFPIW